MQQSGLATLTIRLNSFPIILVLNLVKRMDSKAAIKPMKVDVKKDDQE